MGEDPLEDYGQYKAMLIHRILPKLLKFMTDIVNGIRVIRVHIYIYIYLNIKDIITHN